MEIQTYNGLNVPNTISPNMIISAFKNCMEEDKINKYTENMSNEYDYTFPPIMGFPIMIDNEFIEDNTYFLNGEEISEEHKGQIAWMVTDGHHRTFAAINTEKCYIDVELDRSCITREDELEFFDNN